MAVMSVNTYNSLTRLVILGAHSTVVLIARPVVRNVCKIAIFRARVIVDHGV